MPTRKRNAKGHFIKGGHHTAHARRASGGALVVVERTAPARRKRPSHHVAKHHKKHRRHGGGGGMNLTTLALAGAGIAFMAGSSSPIQAIPDNIAKIPGAKTFGNVATAGLGCLAATMVSARARRNKYVRAGAVIGVILAAVQLGTQGTKFKFVGDPDNSFLGDVDGE